MEHALSQLADDVLQFNSDLDDSLEGDRSSSEPPDCLPCSQTLEQLKQTESDLRESQERLQLMMQGSRDGFWDWNIAKSECYVSDRWKELRGFAADADLDDPLAVWKEGIHPADRDRVLRAFYAHLDRKSTSFNEEYRVYRQDGSYVWVLDRGRALWDDRGQAIRIAGSETDITYLKQTEQALRHNELVYRMLADTMPQIFWITHADGYHEYFNQRWYDYTGQHPGEGDGEGWQNILHPDDIEATTQSWQESLQTGKPYNVEYRLRNVSGEYRWHIGRALPLPDQDGRILRWFGSCTDIHDQKCAIEERAQALERERAARMEQEKANRLKDEFLAVLSHELRSPLNPILGWINLLRTRKLDAAKFEQALETIDRNAKLQAQLIEDLLDVSRILRGKLALTFAPVNLVTATEAALETVRLSAQAKNIQIEKHFEPGMQKVSGDFNRLQQVIWNLLSNAVKFTPKNGRITIELSTAFMSESDFSSTAPTVAQIIVRDTGKGISKDFLPFVFEQFRQADSSTTRQFGGLGLGLAIVRHIVEMHNGTIAVESPGENQGASFTIRLPFVKATVPSTAPVASTPAAPTPHLPLAGLEILVVDDEPDARYLLNFLLEQYGATVKTAESARMALECLESFQPDLLVSDLGMPEMDGYALIRKIRAEGRSFNAIAVTAYAREEDRNAALEAGFQAHVTKPIEPTELVKTIATLAGRSM